MTFCFLTVRSGVGDLLRHSFYLSSRDSPLVSHFSAGTAQKSLGPLYLAVFIVDFPEAAGTALSHSLISLSTSQKTLGPLYPTVFIVDFPEDAGTALSHGLVSLSTAQKSLGPLYPTVLSHCRLPSRRWDCFIFHGCVVSFLARISGSKDPQVQPPESLVMVRTARTWSNRDPALYLVVIPVLCAGILIHDMVETLTSVKIDCAVSLAHFLGSVCCLGL